MAILNQVSIVMNQRSIISDREALQIFANDLRRSALEKHAAELNNATAERKAEILAQIERDIQKEMRQRSSKVHQGFLLH